MIFRRGVRRHRRALRDLEHRMTAARAAGARAVCQVPAATHRCEPGCGPHPVVELLATAALDQHRPDVRDRSTCACPDVCSVHPFDTVRRLEVDGVQVYP